MLQNIKAKFQILASLDQVQGVLCADGDTIVSLTMLPPFFLTACVFLYLTNLFLFPGPA